MEDRKPGCFNPITSLFAVGCMCLLAAFAFFQRAYSTKPIPSGDVGVAHVVDYGAAVAWLFGVGFAFVGIGVLSILLIVEVVLILMRKK